MNVVLLRYNRRLSRQITSYSLGSLHFDRTIPSIWSSITLSRIHNPANTYKWYSSSCQRCNNDIDAIASLSPEALRSKLLESIRQSNKTVWDAHLQQAANLGKDGSYIIEELLTKAIQRNDLSFMHTIVKAVNKFQFQFENSADSSSRKQKCAIISTPLLSAAAACAADNMNWPLLNDTTKLLVFSSASSSSEIIPKRLMSALLSGLLTTTNGRVEVLDLLTFIMKQNRESLLMNISFLDVLAKALSMGATSGSILRPREQFQEALVKCMETCLCRCRDDGVVSADVSKFIVAFALRGKFDDLAAEFVRKTLVASQKQYQLMNSFLPDKPFSLRNWANNHPQSLLQEYTMCLGKIMAGRQINDYAAVVSDASKDNNYSGLFSAVNFELLKQAFPLYEQTILANSIDQQFDNSYSKGSSNKQYEKSEFFVYYWHLEYLARGASFLKPRNAACIAQQNVQRFDNANGIFDNLYEQLKAFANDSSCDEVEIGVDNGYSRRLLRYLCDAFRFHHSPIYASSSASSVPHDSDKLNDALRQPKSTQRNGESFITRLRIRKLSQQEEEDSENESIDNDELHDSTPASFRFQRKRLPQFGKNYIPSWMELVKGDMCLTSSGQNSSVSDTIATSQTSSLYRENYRFTAKPLFWPETFAALQQLSDKELYCVIQRLMTRWTSVPCTSWLLLVSEYLSYKRNIPLPANFFTNALSICDRSRDLYGVLEVLYLAQHENWKSKHDVIYQKKLNQWQEDASIDLRGHQTRLSTQQWAQAVDIAAKSVKLLKSHKSLHPTIVEILSLQQQQRRELSPSSVKNLIFIFSLCIDRESSTILKMVEKNLDASTCDDSLSNIVDRVEIIALTNYLLHKIKQVAMASYKGFHDTTGFQIRRPIFKLRDYVRFQQRDVPKIIDEFLLSTVPDPNDRIEFHNSLWPRVSTTEGRVAVLDYVTRHIDQYSFASLSEEDNASPKVALHEYETDLAAFVAQTRMAVLVTYLATTWHGDNPNSTGGIEDAEEIGEGDRGSIDSYESSGKNENTGNIFVSATQLLLQLAHTQQALMPADGALFESFKRHHNLKWRKKRQ